MMGNDEGNLSKSPGFLHWTSQMTDQERRKFLEWIDKNQYRVSSGSIYIYVSLYQIHKTCERIYDGNKVKNFEIAESFNRVENYLIWIRNVICVGAVWQIVKDIYNFFH